LQSHIVCYSTSPRSYIQVIAKKKTEKCPHKQGWMGVEPVRKFCGQGGGGQFFVILYELLLWTVS